MNLIRKVERDTKLSLQEGNFKDPRATSLRFSDKIPKEEVAKYQIPSLPIKAQKITDGHWIPIAKDNILKLFDSNNTCAVFLGYHTSLKTYGMKLQSLPLPVQFHFEQITEKELLYSVINAVRHPLCIQAAAKKFITDIFHNSQYVAIHWRYDMEEWGRFYSKESYSKDMYNNLKLITPEDVANGVKISLKSVKSQPQQLFIGTIPSTMKFAASVAKILGFETTVINSEKFVMDNYKGCLESNGWNIGEVVSMLDMEICERSDVFYFSKYSTWSENVQPKRVLNAESGIKGSKRKDEFSIYDVSVQPMRKRMENL